MLFLFYVGAPLAVILFSAYHILHVHGAPCIPHILWKCSFGNKNQSQWCFGFHNSLSWSQVLNNTLLRDKKKGRRERQNSQMSVARQQNNEQFWVCNSCCAGGLWGTRKEVKTICNISSKEWNFQNVRIMEGYFWGKSISGLSLTHLQCQIKYSELVPTGFQPQNASCLSLAPQPWNSLRIGRRPVSQQGNIQPSTNISVV